MLILRDKVIMCCRRALQEAVTPALRAVTVDYNNKLMVLRAYFDNGATVSDKKLLDGSLNVIAADLKKEIEKFNLDIVDLPSPGKMKVLKDWVYRRAED
jgi:hypothetical protein